MQLVRCAEPPSRIGADLRAMLSAIGPGDDSLGGVALVGLRLPGLDLTIDAVLLLARGIVVATGVDLPGPAVRLQAPSHGPWLVDGWRLVRNGDPVGTSLAAAGAVAARLRGSQAPDLPVSPVVAVGPYVREVIKPDGDARRPPLVLHPTPRLLVRVARNLASAPSPCDAGAAAHLLGLLAPGIGVDRPVLLEEGFPAQAPIVAQPVGRARRLRRSRLSRERGSGGRW